MRVLKGVFCRLSEIVQMLLNREQLIVLVERLVAYRARRISPDDALRMLFDLDNRLYALQGEMSVRYGNGVHTKHRHTRYHDFFCDRVQDGKRVLDLGCGFGAVAHKVATICRADVVAIDLNFANIAKARELFSHPRVSYIVGDALELTPNGTFDFVILSNVLEHLTDRVQFLTRLMEVVGPARLLIRVPCFDRDWRVPLKRELGSEWRLDPTHETEYTLESFAAETGAAGLRFSHLEVRWGEIWSELCPI